MKIKAIVALSVVMAVALFPACAFAQYAPEVLKITGDPKIMKKAQAAWTSASVKMALSDGDRIKTAKGESIEIGFIDNRKNLIRIGGDTDAIIVSGQNPYTVELINGEVAVLLMGLPEDSVFQVKAPTGISVARGTGWRSLTDGKTSTFEAYDNTIYVKGINADGSIMEYETFVDMGYKTVVGRYQSPGTVEKLTSQDIDRWNVWRNEVKNREAKSSEVND